MRRAAFILCVLLASAASAKGVLPCMVYRHGLTDEQLDSIFARHPAAELRLTAQDWRGMQYQLHRFANMTNYVQQIGSTQDCARVLLRLHDTAQTLTSSNAVLRTAAAQWQQAAGEWQQTADAWRTEYAVATNNLQAALADYMSASNRAARAEARHDAVVGWCEQQRDKALLPTTKAIWQAIIDKLEEQ